MTGGQRSRLLKTGGVIVTLVLFFLYLFAPSNTAGEVKELVKGEEANPPVCEQSLMAPFRSYKI